LNNSNRAHDLLFRRRRPGYPVKLRGGVFSKGR
jgi:hypothetical protein